MSCGPNGGERPCDASARRGAAHAGSRHRYATRMTGCHAPAHGPRLCGDVRLEFVARKPTSPSAHAGERARSNRIVPVQLRISPQFGHQPGQAFGIKRRPAFG